MIEWGELDHVRDVAAVLEYRLGPPTPGGPLATLPGVPQRLAASEWGDYLDQRAHLVTTLAAATSPAAPPATVGDGDWLDGLPETVRRDPRNRDLAERLTEMGRTRPDVPALLAESLAGEPLPTEVPADALWWRVVGHAATTPTPANPAPMPALPQPSASKDHDRLRDVTPYRQRPDRGHGPSR